MVRGDDLPGDAGIFARLSVLAHAADQPPGPDEHEGAGPYPGTIQPEPWQLWSPEDDDGAQGGRP